MEYAPFPRKAAVHFLKKGFEKRFVNGLICHVLSMHPMVTEGFFVPHLSLIIVSPVEILDSGMTEGHCFYYRTARKT